MNKKSRKHSSLDDQYEVVSKDSFLLQIAEQVIADAEIDWMRTIGIDTKPQSVLELGGAGGVTKILRPNWIVSDIREAPGIDLIANCLSLPFEDEKFDLVFAQDVLHHIGDLDLMFNELKRVLKPDGAVYFKEPYWSVPAKTVWKFLHPEDFSLKRLTVENEYRDPMDGNQALAYALLRKQEFLPEFDFLDHVTVGELGVKTGLAFALSGGSTFTTKVPRSWLIALHNWEMKHPGYLKFVGFSIVFSIRFK